MDDSAAHGERRSRVVVVCIGNPYRRDDGVGAVVGASIRRHALPGVDVVNCDGEATRVMESWRLCHLAVVVDAVAADGRGGQIHRFDAARKPIPVGTLRFSTHGFGLNEAIELARVVDQLPPHLIVYGVEGEDFGEGKGLSDGVASAVDEVVKRILEDIRTLKEHSHA